jgi:hypothetical protein
MIVIRCTQRLARRFRIRFSEEATVSTCVLGDWYANLLNVGRSRLVLCLSERALLPVLLPARQADFPNRFPEYLVPILERIGVPQGLIEAEVVAAGEVMFAPTRSRQVLGVLNDFALNADTCLDRGASLLEASLMLAQMPSKPIHYDSPGRVAQSLFSVAGRA